MRTHNCGEVTEKHIDGTVELCGWVNRRRDLGQLIFLDLRDRYGITQVVVEEDREEVSVAHSLRSEDVVAVEGVVPQVKPLLLLLFPLTSTGTLSICALAGLHLFLKKRSLTGHPNTYVMVLTLLQMV